MSTAHEPAYSEDGMPKQRYRLYHAEKAKGGMALTMIGGSSVVAPDKVRRPSATSLLYKDECVPWLKELADDVHEKGADGYRSLTSAAARAGARTIGFPSSRLPMCAKPPIAPSPSDGGS